MREFHRNFHKVLPAFVPSLCSSKSKIFPRQCALPLLSAPLCPFPVDALLPHLWHRAGLLALCTAPTQAPAWRSWHAQSHLVALPPDKTHSLSPFFLYSNVPSL